MTQKPYVIVALIVVAAAAGTSLWYGLYKLNAAFEASGYGYAYDTITPEAPRIISSGSRPSGSSRSAPVAVSPAPEISGSSEQVNTSPTPADPIPSSSATPSDTTVILPTPDSSETTAPPATEAPIAPTVVPTPKFTFTRELYLGLEGEDVQTLQIFLNSQDFTLAAEGPGSPGNETLFFGPLTQSALIGFQTAQNITPAIGYFGPRTKARVESLMAN